MSNDEIYKPRSLNLPIIDKSDISNKNEHNYDINDFPLLSPVNNKIIPNSWINIIKNSNSESLPETSKILNLKPKLIKKKSSKLEENKLEENKLEENKLEENKLEENKLGETPKKQKQPKKLILDDGWTEIKTKTKIKNNKKKNNEDITKLTEEIIKQCIS